MAQTKDQIIANLALISRLHQDIIRGCTTEEEMDGITKLITGECDLCGDTGWIVSYGPGAAGKYPCSCEKGTDKAKKTDYMGPVKTIDDYKKQKAVLASFQQQYNDYTKSQEIQFTSSSLQVGQTAPAPAPPEPLPPAVGRKFR